MLFYINIYNNSLAMSTVYINFGPFENNSSHSSVSYNITFNIISKINCSCTEFMS